MPWRCAAIQARLLTCRSCFNAFSRVDVRVDVRIPGGVDAYVVDLRGERYVSVRLGAVLNVQSRSNARDLAGGLPLRPLARDPLRR